MNNRIQLFTAYATLILLLTLTACNSINSNGDEPAMSLSFIVSESLQPKTAASIQSNHVTITEAKILVREVEFESDIDDDGISDDSLDFEAGPFVVVLNLDGALNKVKTANVPEGRYDEIEFDIHKPEDNETPPDPEFKIGTSGDERFSVIVRGTYNDQDFLYRSRVNMEQEIELKAPLVVDGNSEVNATLSVDVSSWFVDSNGDPMDPTLDSNRDEIDNAIKSSFEAFEDNDEDGLED